MAARCCIALLAVLFSLVAPPATAVEVRVLSEGQPVTEAVVTLTPIGSIATLDRQEAWYVSLQLSH